MFKPRPDLPYPDCGRSGRSSVGGRVAACWRWRKPEKAWAGITPFSRLWEDPGRGVGIPGMKLQLWGACERATGRAGSHLLEIRRTGSYPVAAGQGMEVPGRTRYRFLQAGTGCLSITEYG